MWCIPKLTPEFKERMEDILTLYEKPYDHLDIDLTVNKFYKNFN